MKLSVSFLKAYFDVKRYKYKCKYSIYLQKSQWDSAVFEYIAVKLLD